jgi:XTP/dITP diphosphohydrolase
MDLSKGVLLATGNKNKIKEILSILKNIGGLKAFSLADKGFMEMDIPETGRTFKENAYIKAKAYAEKYNMVTLADDSGLEVSYLGGEPGVNSARYAGDKATDNDKISKLLASMRGVGASQRHAAFKCLICVYDPVTDEQLYSEGVCEGSISELKKGNNGFGYDPVFVVAGINKTMAELSAEQKNRVSHRAKALDALKDAMVAFCKF